MTTDNTSTEFVPTPVPTPTTAPEPDIVEGGFYTHAPPVTPGVTVQAEPVTQPEASPPAEAPVTDSSGVLSEPPTVEFHSQHEFNNFVADDIIQLHKELEKIAPIMGISAAGAEAGGYRVDYSATVTPEQMVAVQAFISEWPDYKEKQRKLKHNYELLEQWFAEQIAAGCTVSDGFTLGLTDRDITLLTGNYMLAQAAAGAGLPLPPIVDNAQGLHEVASLADFTRIMLEYGQYRAGLSKTYAESKAAIDAAAAAL